MYDDGDMMGSDEEAMHHDMMGDSYGMEGSHEFHDVRLNNTPPLS